MWTSVCHVSSCSFDTHDTGRRGTEGHHMLSDTVAERIILWRKRHGWNRERLAERCAEVGMPELTASAITNIESGRRKPDGTRRRTITVDELAVLAWALDVPPISLLSAYPEKESVDILPNWNVSSVDAAIWFSADVPKIFTHEALKHDNEVEDHASHRLARYSDALHPILLARKHELVVWNRLNEMDRREDELRAYVEVLRGGEIESQITSEEFMQKVTAQAKIEEMDRELVSIRNALRAKGYPLPDLPNSIKYLADETDEDLESPVGRLPIVPNAAKIADYLEHLIEAGKS